MATFNLRLFGMLSDCPLPRHRFDFLDYLRAMAAWAVVYDHVLCQMVPAKGIHLRLVSLLTTYVTAPLGIIQDFGWLAVATFFLISGFIITHVAGREMVLEFLLKRFLRIMPLLAAFVLLQILARPGLWHSLSWTKFALSLTLLNWFTPSSTPVLGVGWTLAIEMMFYLMTAATMGARRQGIMLLAGIVIPFGIECSSRWFGAVYFLVAANAAYLPYLVVGQILYLGAYARTISPLAMLAALGACYFNLMLGILRIHTQFLAVGNSYLISFAYAVGVFSIMLSASHQIASPKAVRYLADTSFEVYLVHGVLCPVALDFLWPVVGGHAAIVAALAGTFLIAALTHRFVTLRLSSLAKTWVRSSNVGIGPPNLEAHNR